MLPPGGSRPLLKVAWNSELHPRGAHGHFAHSLNFKPSHQLGAAWWDSRREPHFGRGLVTPAGEVHTWDEATGMTHERYVELHHLPDNYASFSIRPDGTVNAGSAQMTRGLDEDWTWRSKTDIERRVAAVDPRLHSLSDRVVKVTLGRLAAGWTEALHPREWHGHFARIAGASHRELARSATAAELRRAESYARKTGHLDAASKLARARLFQDRHPQRLDVTHPLRASVAGIRRERGHDRRQVMRNLRHLGSHLRNPEHTTEAALEGLLTITGLV